MFAETLILLKYINDNQQTKRKNVITHVFWRRVDSAKDIHEHPKEQDAAASVGGRKGEKEGEREETEIYEGQQRGLNTWGKEEKLRKKREERKESENTHWECWEKERKKRKRQPQKFGKGGEV